MPAFDSQNINHILVYECNSDYNGDPIIPAGNCFSRQSYTNHCKKLINGWSAGANTKFYYPDDAGHPISSDLYSFILVEVRYNNYEYVKLGKNQNIKL